MGKKTNYSSWHKSLWEDCYKKIDYQVFYNGEQDFLWTKRHKTKLICTVYFAMQNWILCFVLNRFCVKCVNLLNMSLRLVCVYLYIRFVTEMLCHVFMFSGYLDEAEKNRSLRENLCHLPDDNLVIFSHLMHFLSRVAAHSHSNHMPVENLATIFGPCIFQ